MDRATFNEGCSPVSCAGEGFTIGGREGRKKVQKANAKERGSGLAVQPVLMLVDVTPVTELFD